MLKQFIRKLNNQNSRIVIALIFAGIVAMLAGLTASTVLQKTSTNPKIEISAPQK